MAGLGGLGDLGVKFATALGADVTVLSRTPDMEAGARALGAADPIVTTDSAQMDRARGTFDLILDTIAAPHELSDIVQLLDLDGTLSVLGFFGPIPTTVVDLLGRKKVSSSGTGGRKRTDELLAFCADHGLPDHCRYRDSALRSLTWGARPT